MEFQDLPLGLGMGLAMNIDALDRFGRMSEAEKEKLIFESKDAKSKSEMDRIISSLASDDSI